MELALRGRRWWWRRWHALSAASLLCPRVFMVLHLVHHSPLWGASGFIPSLLFACVRERHRCLGAPIGLHVLFNLEFFAAAALAVG